jgi:FAD-dependent oxidoreductase domain-containing protein 1
MECDILVVGSGVLGLSSAYHLKLRNPDSRVVVIDRSGGPGQGNSAKSEGGLRNVFTSEANYLLTDSTIDWFSHLQNDLGYDVKLHYIGYLWLYSEGQYNGLKSTLDAIQKWGAELRTYEKEELKRMVPDLVTDLEGDEEAELLDLEPVYKGVLGVKCGCIDTDALVRSYEAELLKLGGELMYSTEAKKLILRPEEELGIPGEPFVWQESLISGAETSRGEIRADTTVLATGVWSEILLDPLGIDALMRAKKRQIFVFKDPKLRGLLEVEGFNEYTVMPLTILPKAGILFRPEVTEGSIWLACADELGRGYGLEEDPQPEANYYTDEIYHVLVKYFPCFRDIRPVNMWAGQYAVNGYDEMPVIAPVPGMIYIGAASGSGIMKCDALGRIVASLYASEEKAELYGGQNFNVSDLGVEDRNVERENFII